MYYPRTERQQRFITLAEELAAVFAERAEVHDREGSFPFENFDDIRAAGLPALVIPAEFGGWNADLLEAVMVMETLATGDGSTALSLSMHMQSMGGAAESRLWPPALFERICRDAVEKGALINACATEPELGSPSRGGKPKTSAYPVYPPGQEGGEPEAWIISGRKNFASMSPALDYFIIPATLQDGSEDVARFIIPRSDAIEIVPTWDALGMRSTGSHDIVIHDVRAPHANLISRTDAHKPIRGGPINAWFMLLISASYLGVAEAALKAASRYANERVPTALGRPIATLENIQRRLGKAELLIHQAQVQLYSAADLWTRHPEQRLALSPSIAAAKMTVTNNAVKAVDECMRVVGGAAMTRRLPLERYFRDVRGGLSHPINDDQALVMFGRGALEEG